MCKVFTVICNDRPGPTQRGYSVPKKTKTANPRPKERPLWSEGVSKPWLGTRRGLTHFTFDWGTTWTNPMLVRAVAVPKWLCGEGRWSPERIDWTIGFVVFGSKHRRPDLGTSPQGLDDRRWPTTKFPPSANTPSAESEPSCWDKINFFLRMVR